MDDLLTTKQVQDYLKVDRTTVYRMLKDGRLNGVKVGQQWRFPRQDVDTLFSGPPDGAQVTYGAPREILPLECVQSIQDVCAEIAEIGSLTTDNDGVPLTDVSNCSHFCRLILDSPTGYQACVNSWRELARQTNEPPEFVTCHAGLQYARARINVDGQHLANLVGGQFFTDRQRAERKEANAQHLAVLHAIDPDELVDTARDLPLLDDRKQTEIDRWLKKVARAFEQISCERANLIDRLRKIAVMSLLE